MTTASALIASSMKKIGVVLKSESPDADEAVDGLSALNAMLSSWSNESLLVYSRVTETLSLVGGTALYTIGSGQTFNTVRPINIVEAHVTIGTIDYHLEIIPDDVYNAIPDKSSQGTPVFLNYSNEFPAGKIRLYPVPSAAYSLTILSEKPLVTLALTDTLALPAGWERALIYNLAVEIAPEYGVQIDPLILQIARESKGLISLSSSRNRPSKPLSHGGNRNILSGYR